MKFYLSTLLLVVCTSLGISQESLKVSFGIEDIINDQVEISVNVNDFTDIYGFQLFLLWDPEVLSIDNMSYANPDLSGMQMIKPEDDASNNAAGKLRLNWLDGLNGSSITDGDAICRLQYNMIGEPCATTSLSIGNIGGLPSEKIEILDNGLNNLGAESTDMEFQIPGAACSTNIKEVKEIATVRIYPNPVRDNLQVSFKNHTPKASQFYIYNEAGSLLNQTELTTVESNINISDINNGIYFYEIRDKGVIVDYGKIMKI